MPRPTHNLRCHGPAGGWARGGFAVDPSSLLLAVALLRLVGAPWLNTRTHHVRGPLLLLGQTPRFRTATTRSRAGYPARNASGTSKPRSVTMAPRPSRRINIRWSDLISAITWRDPPSNGYHRQCLPVIEGVRRDTDEARCLPQRPRVLQVSLARLRIDRIEHHTEGISPLD